MGEQGKQFEIHPSFWSAFNRGEEVKYIFPEGYQPSPGESFEWRFGESHGLASITSYVCRSARGHIYNIKKLEGGGACNI